MPCTEVQDKVIYNSLPCCNVPISWSEEDGGVSCLQMWSCAVGRKLGKVIQETFDGLRT